MKPSTKTQSLHLTSLEKALPFIDQYLEALLGRIVEQELTKALSSSRSLPPIGESPLADDEDKALSPDDVRIMAECSAQAVSDAIKSGALPARPYRPKNRRTRIGPNGSKIPGFVWQIKREDALQFQAWYQRFKLRRKIDGPS